MNSTPKWVIARILETKEVISEFTGKHALQVRFKPLESVKLPNGKRARWVYASFSLDASNPGLIKELFIAAEYPMPAKPFTLSRRSLYGRYCRLGITIETYEGIEHLRVRRFTTINTPVRLDPIQMVNEGLKALRISAHMDGAALVIDPIPEPEEDYQD